jgi:anti-sigma factor RsiW
MRCLPDKTLQEYLDGELPETKNRRADKHLARCKKCSQRLADSRAQTEFIRKKLGLLYPAEIPAAPAICPGNGRYEMPRKAELRRLFAATIKVPAAAVAMTVLFVAGISLGIVLGSRSEGARVRGGETKSTPLYVSTSDRVQILSLNWDFTGYRPIEHPQSIIFKEEQK